MAKRYIKFDIRYLTVSVFTIAAIWCCVQIKTRGFDFNYYGQTKNYQMYEQKSKEIQKKILGKNLYTVMAKIDGKLGVNF
jgi:hypothetical protein